MLMWVLLACGLGKPDNPYDSCIVFYEIACDTCDVGGICDEDDREEQVIEKCEAIQLAHDEGNVAEGYEWDEDSAACFNAAYEETCDEVTSLGECYDIADDTGG